MHDLADRLTHRVQLTTDGHRAYLSAVEDAFGAGIDYAMLQKIYGNSEQGPETRYSPAICMGARKAVISGNPDHTFQRPTSSARISPCACRCADSRG
jgi:hypothetical protein